MFCPLTLGSRPCASKFPLLSLPNADVPTLSQILWVLNHAEGGENSDLPKQCKSVLRDSPPMAFQAEWRRREGFQPRPGKYFDEDAFPVAWKSQHSLSLLKGLWPHKPHFDHLLFAASDSVLEDGQTWLSTLPTTKPVQSLNSNFFPDFG